MKISEGTKDLIHLIENKPVNEAILLLSGSVKGPALFSSSLSMEDQIITDIIFSNNLPVEIFTIDTGRMFYETYELHRKTEAHYKKQIKIYYPDSGDVERLINQKGQFSFYDSAENRKECCFIRKVVPLQRALKGASLWITGIRAEHSNSRGGLPILEWDPNYKLYKYHPLLNWTGDQVKHYIHENNIPYNPLHDSGFISIGCQPCTRAVHKGEDFRSGRWWWEQESHKECGLHYKTNTELK